MRNSTNRLTHNVLLGVGLALPLLVAQLARAEAVLIPVAGCGAEAATPPGVLKHKVARCEPSAPAPMPLAEKTPFTIGITSLNVEYAAPLAIGLAKGEFEKENLDVKVEIMPTPDATQLVAQGRLDAGLSAPDASFHNAAGQGYNVRWVAGNFSAPEKGGAGLWAKKGTALADLKGEVLGSVVGPGSTVALFISDALETAGMKLADVTLQRFETATLITALDNDAAKAIWLTDPAWAQISDKPEYTKLAGQPGDQPFGGLVFGPSLLDQKRKAGEAFVRAYVRVINTYLRDDYKADPAFVAELAGILKIPRERLTVVPSAVWDWEIRDGTTDRLQGAMAEGKALKYEGLLPQGKLIDRSFYQTAVGRK